MDFIGYNCLSIRGWWMCFDLLHHADSIWWWFAWHGNSFWWWFACGVLCFMEWGAHQLLWCDRGLRKTELVGISGGVWHDDSFNIERDALLLGFWRLCMVTYSYHAVTCGEHNCWCVKWVGPYGNAFCCYSPHSFVLSVSAKMLTTFNVTNGR